MKVKIKKVHPDAVIPTYSKVGDAGMDLVATDIDFDDDTGLGVYGTGIAVEIPVGYVGLIFPRSSITKTALRLSNAVGVIDSGYRGEIKCKFDLSSVTTIKVVMVGLENTQQYDLPELDGYKVGDRIAQLVIIPYPEIEFEEVEELSQTERGDGAYGSTGK